MKGMTAKAWTNLWKLSTVYACSRSTIRNMIWGEVIDFLVTVADVESAWEVVQLSIHTMKCFKPSLKVELNESSIELSSEELVIKGAMKIKKMYELADENMEIRLTKVVKFKLYPARSTLDNFVAVSFMNFKYFTILKLLKALKEMGIVEETEKRGENHKVFKGLKLVSQTTGDDMTRLFVLISKEISDGIFDPLNILNVDL